jgi:hypothetical protein
MQPSIKELFSQRIKGRRLARVLEDEEVLSQIQQPPPITQEPELEVNDDEIAEKLEASENISEKQAFEPLVDDGGELPAKKEQALEQPENDPREEEKQPI